MTFTNLIWKFNQFHKIYIYIYIYIYIWKWKNLKTTKIVDRGGTRIKPSPISPCVCVKIFSILKRKNSGLISHWKINVSYKSLKSILCIQELGYFEYTPLLVSLKPSLLSPFMCVKIYSNWYTNTPIANLNITTKEYKHHFNYPDRSCISCHIIFWKGGAVREKSMLIACNKQSHFSRRGEREKRVVIIRLSFL